MFPGGTQPRGPEPSRHLVACLPEPHPRLPEDPGTGGRPLTPGREVRSAVPGTREEPQKQSSRCFIPETLTAERLRHGAPGRSSVCGTPDTRRPAPLSGRWMEGRDRRLSGGQPYRVPFGNERAYRYGVRGLLPNHVRAAVPPLGVGGAPQGAPGPAGLPGARLQTDSQTPRAGGIPRSHQTEGPSRAGSPQTGFLPQGRVREVPGCLRAWNSV